jgi:Right handed beta helix region
MTKNRSLLAASIIALLVASSPALAASSRTFVSGAGTDTGACATTEPCRTFAYALTQTAPSGEIIVLTSAGYGAVTINQSVSIINTSNFAGVTVASGDGITINAGTNDSVTLRGLTVDGGGAGSNGIVFNTGSTLTIDQCDVMNFENGGIVIQPTVNNNIIITNTTASNNSTNGIYYNPQSGSVTTGIVIDHVSVNNNRLVGIDIGNSGTGINSAITATVSISNSIASFNAGGFFLSGATVSLDASNASNNSDYGVLANSGTVALGRSVIMNNTSYGLIYGTTVNSYKDNRIAGNGTQAGGGGTINAATLY